MNEAGAYKVLAGYSLEYFNSNGYCFTVGAFLPPAGTPIGIEEIEVFAPEIGGLILSITEFDTEADQMSIRLAGNFSTPENWFEFYTPSYTYFGNTTSDRIRYNTVPLQESIKIVESLSYLNP